MYMGGSNILHRSWVTLIRVYVKFFMKILRFYLKLGNVTIQFCCTYHLYEWRRVKKLKLSSVRSKLRGFLAFSIDCVPCFIAFFTFPESLRCVLTVFYPQIHILY